VVTYRSMTTSSVVGHALICSLGVAAIVWGAYAFPIFWRQAPIEQIAKHVIAGDSFKVNTLNALAQQLDAVQVRELNRPSVLSSIAVIHLRFLEKAIADGDQRTMDKELAKLRTIIPVSLANTPADPFLWMILYWTENTRSGFSRTHFKFLRMSYLLGPNEGWIAVNRNRLALAVYPALPHDLAESAVSEFAQLVDSDFVSEAADILIGPGWPIRSTLLLGLKHVALDDRQEFAKIVYMLGYDITVPGVERPAWRPWQ
jgi:hypothetical protein